MARSIGMWALAVLLLGPASAKAEAPRPLPKSEFTLAAGAHRFRRGSRLEDHFVLRAALGRTLTPYQGIEGHVTLALAGNASQPFPGEGGVVQADALLYGIDYVLYLRRRQPVHPGCRFLPYVSAGVEGLFPIGSGTRGDRSLVVGIGVGAKYFITSRISFHALFRLSGTSMHVDREDPGPESDRNIRIDTLVTGISVLI